MADGRLLYVSRPENRWERGMNQIGQLLAMLALKRLDENLRKEELEQFAQKEELRYAAEEAKWGTSNFTSGL